MLEVGCQHGPGGPKDPGLSEAETRSHFGAWAIVSSPLTLSHDVTNATVMDAVWPLISNREVIAINQAWAGHSGSPFARSEDLVAHAWREAPREQDRSGRRELAGEAVRALQARSYTSPSWQYFYKPLETDGSRVAVLLMNHASSTADLSLDLSAVPGLACKAATCAVRDVWARKDLGTAKGTYTAKGVAMHDAAFFVLSTPTA